MTGKKMRKFRRIFLLILLLTVLGLGVVFAQGTDFHWAKSAGGVGWDAGVAVSTDASGNIYVTGYFEGTASFDSTDVTSAGGTDIFIAKYTPSGDLRWVNRAGGINFVGVTDIVVDNFGSVYITGGFLDNVTFDSVVLTGAGGGDVFVAKYDSSGNLLWAKSAGGENSEGSGSITSDPDGNIFITGSIGGDATFGTIPVSGIGGLSDIYVAKLDSSGNFQWVRNSGALANESGLAIALDDFGNIYVTGSFTGSFTFGSTTLSTSSRFDGDFLILKYDPFGNPLWAHQATGGSSDIGRGIAIDSFGNSVVTGWYRDDFVIGSYPPFSGDSDGDIFVAKYDHAGQLLWVQVAHGNGYDYGLDVTIDGSDNIFITGQIEMTTTFGPYDVTTVGGNTDIFLAKLDPLGNYLWVKQAGGVQGDAGAGVAVDIYDGAIVTGSFRSSSALFDSTALSNSSSFFTRDIFIAKIGQSPAEIIENIKVLINDLIEGGQLNGGQGNSLIKKIDSVNSFLDKGNVVGAVNTLNAFINQVNSLIAEGVLLAEEGQPLIDAADSLLSLLLGTS
jgi:hypothetical protein